MKLPEFKLKLPPSPFKLYDEPLRVVVEFYKEHLRRDAEAGRLTPPETWMVLRGFLISAAQTYSAVCLLLSEKRPKPLMLQAEILNRSLLETLGSVLALCEAPKARTRLLAREAYKNAAVTFLGYRARFGGDPKWKEYLDVYGKGLVVWAQGIRLSRKLIKTPSLIADQWPTPGRMIYGNKGRKQPPFLRGRRRSVFKNLYDFHYGHQSEQAHQRAAAVGAALLVDDPEAQWNPGLGESRLIADALLFLTCILSELEFQGKYQAHPKLRELWVYLCALGDDAKELWELRYRKLANP